MKKLILATLFLLISSCKGQTEKIETNNKTKAMEKFDMAIFNKMEKDINYTSTKHDMFFKSNDKRYRVLIDDEIQVEETNVNSPYLHYKIYTKKSGHLSADGNDFYSFPIGISKEYNENGELIKETDNDKDYKFSINDLQKKMKNIYNINILDKKQTRSVGRVKTDKRINFAYYHVVVNSNIASFTEYLLNGTTGEVFYTIETIRGDEKDAVDEYVKTLKK